LNAFKRMAEPTGDDVSELTYAEIGATRHEPLPSGYRHLHYRTYLGRDVFEQAGDAVLTFRMHRATGARVTADADRAAPGVRVRVGAGLGPPALSVPCEVVWAADDDRRAGFGYGTLPGHQARGEESFVVERDEHGRVWFTVTAFSVPARLPMRLGGPVARLAQHGYARICGRALKRLCPAPR
jgi:uncharacterized protein (UPF0548 family)